MQFTVKGNQEKVIIRIQGINNLIADDYWDRNWINSEIEIILPGYHANFWVIYGLRKYLFSWNNLKRYLKRYLVLQS